MLLLSILGLAFLMFAFSKMEKKIVLDSQRDGVKHVEDFIANVLKPVMITGNATLMRSIADSYHEMGSVENIEILRTTGEEAFADDKTIIEVNEIFAGEEFKRRYTNDARQVLFTDNVALGRAVRTMKSEVYFENDHNAGHLLRMIIPIPNDEECEVCHGDDHKVRGVVYASVSLAKTHDHIMENLILMLKYASVALLVMLFAAFFLFRKVVLNPISNIVEQINEISEKEEFSARVDVESTDEIGDLSATFNRFISAVEGYQHEQVGEKDRLKAAVMKKTEELREKNRIIEDDMKLAEKVQRRLLPHKLPRTEDIKFHTYYSPCMYVSGDFYDIFEFKEKYIGVFVADTTGHGAPAALLVSIIKTVLAYDARDTISPSAVVNSVNRFLTYMTPDDSNATIFYGIINEETGKMVYSLAGHPSPIICNSNTGTISTLELSGGLVGAFEDSDFQENEYQLNKGDRLLIYTDGISEARGSNGEYFGEERIISILKEGRELKRDNLLNMLVKSMEEYTNGAPHADDVTMVLVDFFGTKK